MTAIGCIQAIWHTSLSLICSLSFANCIDRPVFSVDLTLPFAQGNAFALQSSYEAPTSRLLVH
jgi:hypothetical protein